MFEQDFVNLISRLARYSGEDEATGLRNLRQFLDDTERELARSRRTGENLRILVVEPDSGISLAEVVRVVQGCLSHEDLFARLGGRYGGIAVPRGGSVVVYRRWGDRGSVRRRYDVWDVSSD